MYIRTHISLSCLSSPPPTSTLPHRYPSHTLFSPSLLPHTHIFVPRVVCVACSSYGCSRAIPFLNHLSIDAQWGHRHKHQLPPRPTPPHTHSLPLLSFTTFMSSNLPPLQTAYTILDSRGAGKGCHHHHLHHSPLLSPAGRVEGSLLLRLRLRLRLLLLLFSKHKDALVEVCVCPYITRLTVVFVAQVFLCFVRRILLKIHDKSKRDCGRRTHCQFVRLWTARHFMDSWLNILHRLCKYFIQTPSHAHFSFVSFFIPLTSTLPPRHPSHTLFSPSLLPTHTSLFQGTCVWPEARMGVRVRFHF